MPLNINEWLARPEIAAALITVVLTVVFQWVERRFAPRGRLIWSVSHNNVLVLPPPPSPPQAPPRINPTQPNQTVVKTRDIWVQNSGRVPIRDVEIVLNFQPMHFEIWPQRDFQKSENPDRKLILRFDSLGRREFFVIYMLAVGGEIPLVLTVRSSDGAARQVETHIERTYPRWLLLGLLAIVVMGVFSTAYWIVRLVGAATGN